jgi:hypothetical protein
MRNLSPVFAVGLRKGIIAHQTLFQRFQSQCLIRIYLSVGFPTDFDLLQNNGWLDADLDELACLKRSAVFCFSHLVV